MTDSTAVKKLLGVRELIREFDENWIETSEWKRLCSPSRQLRRFAHRPPGTPPAAGVSPHPRHVETAEIHAGRMQWGPSPFLRELQARMDQARAFG